jgi:hypothetical protein
LRIEERQKGKRKCRENSDKCFILEERAEKFTNVNIPMLCMPGRG